MGRKVSTRCSAFGKEQAWKCPGLGRRLTACGPRLGDMLAVYAARIDADDPLSGLEIGERPDPEPRARAGRRSRVKAAGLNHHDLWSLRAWACRRTGCR